MTLADILASLFLKGHDVSCTKGVVVGSGVLNEAGQATVIGIADRTPVGVDEAIALSAHVLGSIESLVTRALEGRSITAGSAPGRATRVWVASAVARKAPAALWR